MMPYLRHLQNNMKNNNCCILLNKNFVHISTEKNLVCFTNKENLHFMMNCSERQSYSQMVPTFQYAPKHFYQLYAIHYNFFMNYYRTVHVFHIN